MTVVVAQSPALGATRYVEADGLQSQVGDWVALLKPRVIQLVVFTGLVGIVCAPGHIHPVIALTAVLCIAVGAGASGAINMWYDRDIDAIMRRTAKRPIPGRRIEAGAALGFGVVLAVGSVLVLFLATNWVAAALLAVSIAFYVFIYTMWLKRRTPQNIVIGGAAGAFPPLIGWASVTSGIDIFPLLMFGIVFLWTPPHFWALSLYAHDDYARAGVPMLPVVNGARTTRLHVFWYTLALGTVSLTPSLLGHAGLFYTVLAGALAAWFILCAWRVVIEPQDPAGRSLNNDRAARKTFRFSLVYLFVLFAGLALDQWTQALL